MNSIGFIITRLQEQYDSSNKSYKGKIMSGNKERATKQYFKDAAARARRKQGKTRFDTHRREEQPDAEDQRLEDIHFANFLGLPRSEDGIPYNNVHIDEPVNLNECDMYLQPESSKNVPEKEEPEEEDNTYNYGSWAPQISREPNTKWHMNWDYEPETQTLNGYSTFKRTRDEDDSELQGKRIRMSEDDDSLIGREDNTHIPVPFITNWELVNTWPAPEWQDNLNFCEERNRQEQEKFVQEHPDEGRLTVECLRAYANEEANFAAMVAYMKEQVELAEQMAANELTPCDCYHL